jgi:hypothetical protein
MYGKAGHWNWCDDLPGKPNRKKKLRAVEERQWRDEFMVGFDEHAEYEDYLMKMCPCHKHANRPDEM